jgi:hypothetical protein
MAQKPDYSRAHFLAVAAKYRAIAREKPSDGSENCEMLLTHLNSKSAFAATLEGVSFGMKDGKRTVRCLVTYKALTDMVGGAPNQNELNGAFRDDRGDIEDVASAKFDDGKIEADGSVRIDTRDLNPELFAGLPED